MSRRSVRGISETQNWLLLAALATPALNACSLPTADSLLDLPDGGVQVPGLPSGFDTSSLTVQLPSGAPSGVSSSPAGSSPTPSSSAAGMGSGAPSVSPSALDPNQLPPAEIAAGFPVGLEVRSLLATVDVAAAMNLRLQAGPGAMGVPVEEQINLALTGATEAACAVKLPPQNGVGSPACYGPSILYENHPDGTCQPFPGSSECGLPSGDLGIWEATDASGQACTAAKLNADIESVANRVHSALLIAASSACTLRIAGTALPAAGETVDATTGLQAALQVNQPDVMVSSATITNEAATDDAEPQYVYAIEASLAQRSWKFALRHVPGASGAYAGRLWGESTPLDGSSQPPPPPNGPQPFDGGVPLNLLLDGGASDASLPPPPDAAPPPGSAMCPPPPSGNLPPPPPSGSVPPPPSGNLPPPPSGCMPPPPPSGTNVPPPGTNPPPPGTNMPPGPQPSGGSAEVFSVKYELTEDNQLRTSMLTKGGAEGGAAAFTEDGDLSASSGWSQTMALSLLDVDRASGTGKGAYLWQAGPNDDRTRVFNVFTAASASGDLSGCGFFGFGQPFGSELPAVGIENFICNWAGPANDHGGVWATAQKQCMAVDEFGLWVPTESHIAYAPENSCSASSPDFTWGPMDSDPSSWTPFPSSSDLVSLDSDTDYASNFGSGPAAPAAP